MSPGSRPRFLSRKKHVAEGRQVFVASVFSGLRCSSSIWGPISAILLQLGIVVLLLVVLKTEIFVESWASSSNSIHLVYITLLTVLATIITSFTTGSIRKLWFYRSAFLLSDSSSSTASSIKVLAGLGAVIDQLKGWQVSLTFVFAGLITTSIVAGLTPRAVTYVAESQSGQIYTLQGHYCINDLGNRSISGSWFSWTLPNGSIIAYDQNPGIDSRACEAGTGLDFLVNAVPTGRPEQAAYIMGDVQVMQGAAGVPWGLNGLGTVRDSNFLWASRCLPVLKKNPVHCYSGGEISITKGKELWVSDGTGSCFTSSADLSSVVLPTDDFSMIKGACTGNHTLGTATILFAATNGNPNVTRYGVVNGFFSGYADYLAAAVGHGVLLDKVDNTEVSSAICEVDLTQAVDFRLLNYSRADSFGKKQHIGRYLETSVNNGYGYQVQALSNSACQISDDIGNAISLNEVLTNAALATAGGATWPLLAENMFFDGWFDILEYVIRQVGYQNASQGTGVFQDSTNNLEDALGLATAVTLGLFWGGVTTVEDTTTLNNGVQAYERIRLGPSSLWGLIYLIPPLFAIGILVYLLATS